MGDGVVEPHPVARVTDVKETVSFVRHDQWERLPEPWPRSQDLGEKHFAAPGKDDVVFAVSHTWAYAGHPDPGAFKTSPLSELLEIAISKHQPRGKALIFCDFLSVSQRPFRSGQAPRSKDQESAFAKALRAFPQIYLQADAVLHVDEDNKPIERDRVPYWVPPAQVECLADLVFQVSGGSVFVADVPPDSQSLGVGLFDVVDSVGGKRVSTVEELKQAVAAHTKSLSEQAQGGWTWAWPTCSSCSKTDGARMLRCPYGSFSPVPAREKGWVYLERFASMVKGAMVDEDLADTVAFATSEEARQEIAEGARLLRAAAKQGDKQLEETLKYFIDQVERKRFGSISLDKAENIGGLGGFTTAAVRTDADMVCQLMRDLVDDLKKNWDAERVKQRQRQLILAVHRGDAAVAARLIDDGADINAADGHGATCMHSAAMGRNMDMIQLLIARRGDLLRQDSLGQSPAHMTSLYMQDVTVDLFQALAPTEDVLRLCNKAGVSNFERFKTWAMTADNNQPWEPAQASIQVFVNQIPSLTAAARHRDRTSSLAHVDAILSHLEVKCGKRRVTVRVLEPPSGLEVTRVVVWLGAALYMPAEFQFEAVRQVAAVVCHTCQAKIYFLGDCVLTPEDASSGANRALGFQRLIEALPLSQKFTLVDNAIGVGTVVLHRMQARVGAALILNPGFWFSEEFLAGDAFRNACGFVGKHSKSFQDRNIEECAKLLGSFVYAKSPADLEAMSPVYKECLSSASDSFFAFGGAGLDILQNSTRLYQPLKTLTGIPIILACGAHAPALYVQDTVARFEKLMPGSSVQYIPDSKQWWEAEGREQLSCVAGMLSATLHRVNEVSPAAAAVPR